MSSLITIHDGNFEDHLAPIIAGQPKGRGLIKRDFKAHPVGCFASQTAFPRELLIPREAWKDRLAQQQADRAGLEDVRNRGANGSRIPALDQGQFPFCWGHSSTMAEMLARAQMGLPYEQLSAFAVCCMITHYQKVGGFCAKSADFIATRGAPTTALWAQQSMDKSHDNPETWANAKLHRVIKRYDLEPGNRDQYISAKLRGFPSANDYNWWEHSVAGMDLKHIDPNDPDGDEGDILNSWGNWSQDDGIGRVKGRKLIPDGCTVFVVTTASAK